MAGILNSKERLIDFIITDQGRKQISDGRLVIEYASFTDRHTFYEMSGSDHPDVAEDASNRIFFEATDRHQDIIVPEIRAGSFMQSFRAGDFSVEGRRIASGTFQLTPAISETNALTGSDLNRAEIPFLNALVTNFQDQRILETEDVFSNTSGFELTYHTASFVLTDNDLDFSMADDFERMAVAVPRQTIDLNSWPSIYNSDRFDHLCNFKFMPPINEKLRPSDPNVPIGLYPQLAADTAKANYLATNPDGTVLYIDSKSATALDDSLQLAAIGRFTSKEVMLNYLDSKQNVTFTFKDTSNENNFIAQLFEINGSENEDIEKLSIIDFGEFSEEEFGRDVHVYFVGKLRKDSLGAQTFLNLFTVVIQ